MCHLKPLTLVALVAMLVANQLVAAAEPASPPAVDGKQLLREAHARSQQATTLEHYNEIIDLCQQAAETPLSDNLAQYAKKLRAWAHNQRGEYYAEQAGATPETQPEAGSRLDEQALAEFETALELNPDYWKAVHNRGVSRALAGCFDEAISDFTRALALKPDYANAWFNRGEIYYEQEKFDQAIADYSRAIQLNDKDFDTRIRRGHAYFQTRQFQQALADYDRAVEIAPNNAEALANRADANRSLARWQQAADDYLQAVRLDPKCGRAYQGAAWLMATCPDARMRNPDLALRAARQALDLLGREDVGALDALAAAQANNGQYAEAQKTLAEAIPAADEEKARALQQRLELYRQQQPYRDK